MCIFCSIVNGEIPSNKVYEDDTVIAFLDVNPTSYGHTLVVPKEHCDSFLDCKDEIRDRVFKVAQQLANKLEKELKCDGINILTNIHEAAGQSVNHFHVHLIPRYKDHDSVTIEFSEIEKPNFEELLNKLK
jgi:histidine triad (HIT) family protein